MKQCIRTIGDIRKSKLKKVTLIDSIEVETGVDSGQLGNGRWIRTDQHLQFPGLYTRIYFAQCPSPAFLCGGLESLVLHVDLLACSRV